MNLSQAVSRHLERIMGEKEITRRQLSARSGVPYSTIASILKNNSYGCKLNTFIKLCAALDVPTDRFTADAIFNFDNIVIE